jgi:hypothetical protein
MDKCGIFKVCAVICFIIVAGANSREQLQGHVTPIVIEVVAGILALALIVVSLVTVLLIIRRRRTSYNKSGR